MIQTFNSDKSKHRTAASQSRLAKPRPLHPSRCGPSLIANSFLATTSLQTTSKSAVYTSSKHYSNTMTNCWNTDPTYLFMYWIGEQLPHYVKHKILDENMENMFLLYIRKTLQCFNNDTQIFLNIVQNVMVKFLKRIVIYKWINVPTS